MQEPSRGDDTWLPPFGRIREPGSLLTLPLAQRLRRRSRRPLGVAWRWRLVPPIWRSLWAVDQRMRPAPLLGGAFWSPAT
jgi:hypothetical protein